jgi:two-component system CheB/CheR fusion protein
MPESEFNLVVSEMGIQNLSAADSVSDGFPTVGVGASAGGLEALTSLLEWLPTDTGFAFVCIQHLDPKRESLLPGLLAKSTRMPVSQIADGMLVEPNHVYVIPANAGLTFSEHALRLAPREAIAELRMPIDGFLHSLAESGKNRAIAVILSGTGSDGALGLEAIKSQGGITFAQDENSAKFRDMPKNAVATGCVDFVLAPEGIARELARIGRHPYLIRPDMPESKNSSDETAEDLSELFKLMQHATKVDFSIYRRTNVERRIHRRQALRDMDTLAAYVKYLREDPTEVQALYQDLLIKVTHFFRDPEAFDALIDRVFPQLLKGRSEGEPLRLWVPGCATGEEAYSLAICVLEVLDKAQLRIPFQLFASDINSGSIQRARSGFYPENIANDITPKRLHRHFSRTESGYRVNKEVRDLCIFATQDLTKDPPYSRLDLIICRNVLIYMGAALKRIIHLFHYALNPTGFLMLGPSESAIGFSNLFVVTDQKHKIFARADGPSQPFRFTFRAREPIESKVHGEIPDILDFQTTEEAVVLGKYGSASVIINGTMDLLAIGGDVGPYLAISAGRASLNLLKMARGRELPAELRAAVETVKAKGVPFRKEGLTVEQGGGCHFNLEVVPLSSKHPSALLVLFDQLPPPADQPGDATGVEETRAPEHDPASNRDLQILHLKEELAQARQHLLTIIERQGAFGEQAQSEWEEAESNIEELRSVNEELETAKEELQSANEELQSTNEELRTINDQLQTLNFELGQSRNFARSIVETIRNPLLVLDTDLRVTTANHSFYRFFHASPGNTEGRLIYEVEGGEWDVPELRALLGEVLPNHKFFNDFEFEHEFPEIGIKALLLSAHQLDSLQMILVSISDITDHKNAERALRRSEEHLRHSQKMEAIGRLAGGIAHEFNNLLMGILGNCELLLERIGGDDPDRQDIQQISKCADRATSLTTQLLTFSRRQVIQPRELHLNAIVMDLDRMLRRLIGQHIELITATDEGLGTVLSDPGQISQIIMNLVLNARDAMHVGGTLTIETRNVDVDEVSAVQQDLMPGRYVLLAVTDTGVGIDPETQRHLFEPFFTTKRKGFGTGLGLATVYGIVEQGGAKIHFSSAPGRGSSFKIYFPRVAEATEGPDGPSAGFFAEPQGSEVILLVEDDDTIRRLALTFLENKGYKVLEARQGGEGLALCENYQGSIHLLLTDVVMPDLGGRELAEQATLLRPKMKILFMSGYLDDPVVFGVLKGPNPFFLQKPFTLRELGRKVRETLDSMEAISAGAR